MFSRSEDEEIRYETVKDNRTSPIRGCLGNLHEEVESLVHLVTKLEERLSGVMNNHATPQKEETDIRGGIVDRDSGNSPLVQELSTLIQVVKGQRDRIRLLIDKLDL